MMKQASELEKLRKVLNKNQQRCLNSQPFSRQRAYLSRQKCQQKITAIEEDSRTLQESIKIFDEKRQKFDTQELRKLSQNPNQFDSVKILKQLDKVNILIGAMEAKNRPLPQAKAESKCKIKTSYSTRTDSVQSPKSIDSQYYNKVFKKQQRHNLHTEAAVRPRSEDKSVESGKSRTQEDKKMIKIKSKKVMIKVYNPFPTSMNDFI